MRDLYELGDLERGEYVARRNAINAELNTLAPAPIPDLDQARKVLGDFSIFWQEETEGEAKRQFLSLIFEGVWLDERRVVAAQPKPSFLAFFESGENTKPLQKGECKVRERRGSVPDFAPQLRHRGLGRAAAGRGSVAGAGLRRKPATVVEPRKTAIVYRIEESCPLGESLSS
jgi:hypothetical protein